MAVFINIVRSLYSSKNLPKNTTVVNDAWSYLLILQSVHRKAGPNIDNIIISIASATNAKPTARERRSW